MSSANRRTLAAPCGLPVQRLASPAGTRDLIAQVACLHAAQARPTAAPNQRPAGCRCSALPRQQAPGISSPRWSPASGVSSANRRTLAAPCGLPVQRLASPAGTRDLIAQVACLHAAQARPTAAPNQRPAGCRCSALPRQQAPRISSPRWPPASGVNSANRRTLAAPCGLPVQRLASPAGTRDLIAQVACLHAAQARATAAPNQRPAGCRCSALPRQQAPGISSPRWPAFMLRKLGRPPHLISALRAAGAAPSLASRFPGSHRPGGLPSCCASSADRRT